MKENGTIKRTRRVGDERQQRGTPHHYVYCRPMHSQTTSVIIIIISVIVSISSKKTAIRLSTEKNLERKQASHVP